VDAANLVAFICLPVSKSWWVNAASLVAFVCLPVSKSWWVDAANLVAFVCLPVLVLVAAVRRYAITPDNPTGNCGGIVISIQLGQYPHNCVIHSSSQEEGGHLFYLSLTLDT